jgi:hypothetical protein
MKIRKRQSVRPASPGARSNLERQSKKVLAALPVARCLLCGRVAKTEITLGNVRTSVCDRCAGVGVKLLHGAAWLQRMLKGPGGAS